MLYRSEGGFNWIGAPEMLPVPLGSRSVSEAGDAGDQRLHSFGYCPRPYGIPAFNGGNSLAMSRTLGKMDEGLTWLDGGPVKVTVLVTIHCDS